MKDSRVHLSGINAHCKGTIKLDGSKSISNRALIIRALCKENFEIHNLSTSDDTVLMASLLEKDLEIYDVGHAGTTFRFLTSYLAFKEGSQILTGSERMKERPIQALVEALNEIGGNIEYLEKEGYPPLKINAPSKKINYKVRINSTISSQYVSSLLMIAPTLPNGLEIELEGEIVSAPYIEMTLSMMHHFGIGYERSDQTIFISSQEYQGKDYWVEADWSAASYFYSLASMREESNITLKGLLKDSIQGDSQMVEIGSKFGVNTAFDDENQCIQIGSSKTIQATSFLEYNFMHHPDLAQTIFVMAACKGVKGLYSGLSSLRVKETDRLVACMTELAKVHSYITRMPDRFSQSSGKEYFMQEGEVSFDNIPIFDTYGDHRMAMAIAPMCLMSDIEINEPLVVSKSYPKFWNDLETLGININFK